MTRSAPPVLPTRTDLRYATETRAFRTWPFRYEGRVVQIWRWRFGDGSLAEQEHVAHVWPKARAGHGWNTWWHPGRSRARLERRLQKELDKIRAEADRVRNIERRVA